MKSFATSSRFPASFRLRSRGLGPRFNPAAWAVFATWSVFLSLGAAQEAVEDIRDVKDLVKIPQPPNYGLWIALVLGAVCVGFLLWKLLSRPRVIPPLSPAERALSEIDAARSLVDAASPEPLANAVTDAVRRYIEARFGIAAPRQTTEEFLQQVHTRRNPEIAPHKEDLGRFLRFCDAVKFGRGDVAAENRFQLIDSARRFVEASQRPPANPPGDEKSESRSPSPQPA